MFVVESLLPIFVQTLLPVFLVAGAGYALASYRALDSRSIGRLLFYLATPSFVFRSLYQMEIDLRSLQQLALIAAAVTLSAGVRGWLVGMGQERRRHSALALTSAVSNNGNMGIPICFSRLGNSDWPWERYTTWSPRS